MREMGVRERDFPSFELPSVASDETVSIQYNVRSQLSTMTSECVSQCNLEEG